MVDGLFAFMRSERDWWHLQIYHEVDLPRHQSHSYRMKQTSHSILKCILFIFYLYLQERLQQLPLDDLDKLLVFMNTNRLTGKYVISCSYLSLERFNAIWPFVLMCCKFHQFIQHRATGRQLENDTTPCMIYLYTFENIKHFKMQIIYIKNSCDRYLVTVLLWNVHVCLGELNPIKWLLLYL